MRSFMLNLDGASLLRSRVNDVEWKREPALQGRRVSSLCYSLNFRLNSCARAFFIGGERL